jgi:protein-S-isoprenylcysteine O-methyltransferase Ste14
MKNDDILIVEDGGRLPSSVTLGWINLIGLLSFFAALYWLHLNPNSAPVDQTVFALLAASVPIIVLEVLVLKVHRRDSTGMHRQYSGGMNISRSLTKLLGLAGTLAGVGLCYWAFPEYHGSFYAPFWQFLIRYGIWALLLAVPYFFFVDAGMREPRDAYWHVGRLLLGKRDFAWGIIGNHARGWLIKGFFLPLMFVYLCHTLGDASRFIAPGETTSFIPWYEFLYNLSYTVDLVFATIGYILTLRIIDSHMRSTDASMLGWAVALICYHPFYSLICGQYLNYDGNSTFWGPWLAGLPTFQVLWGSVIIALLVVYAWVAITFGCHFSNLTHRGILTNGPFRYTKHPGYIAKNLSWWLISIPFVSTRGWPFALRSCLLLLCTNGVYFMRARTEERHLSADPDYVAYALWMNENGLFRSLGKYIPALLYRRPQTESPSISDGRSSNPVEHPDVRKNPFSAGGAIWGAVDEKGATEDP